MGRRRRSAAGRVARAVLLVLSGWVVLSLAVASTDARSAARSRASACGGGSSSSSLYFYGAGTPVSDTNAAVCETGRVEVSFTSAQAPGCTAGPCGYTGSEVWQPQGGGSLDLVAFRTRGRRRLSATLFLGGPDTVQAAVQRSGANGQTAACSDRSDDQGAGFFTPAVHGGRLVLRLAEPGASVFGTRCAGPLDVDLGAALPAATISVRQIMRGGGVIDLRGTRRFAAHGFSGMVRSNLVLRLARPRTTHRSSRLPPGTRRSRPMRSITVNYRLQNLRGSAVADVRALSDPGECGPFDACGLSGVITTDPGAARGGFFSVSASTSAARPRRDLLAAVGLSARGNPAGIGVFGGGEAQLRGTVAADLRQEGECRDQTRLTGGSLQLGVHAGGLGVSFASLSSQAADSLRTRCPGPDLGQHVLARSTLARTALRRRLLTVALQDGARFSDGPYVVRTRSSLVLTLRRVSVKTQTYREPLPP